VSWSSGDLAGGTGIDVTYEVDGATHTALVPFAIWLCADVCPRDLSDRIAGSQWVPPTGS
jgi:hypothetical protein